MLSRRRIIIAMAALTAASPAASLAARAAASCPRLQAERRTPLQQDFTHACGRCWGGHPLHARPGRPLEARES